MIVLSFGPLSVIILWFLSISLNVAFDIITPCGPQRKFNNQHLKETLSCPWEFAIVTQKHTYSEICLQPVGQILRALFKTQVSISLSTLAAFPSTYFYAPFGISHKKTLDGKCQDAHKFRDQFLDPSSSPHTLHHWVPSYKYMVSHTIAMLMTHSSISRFDQMIQG